MKMICYVDGCGHAAYKAGLCNTHYIRMRRHGSFGDPVARRTFPREKEKWVLRHVSHDTDECLKWPYDVDKDGYPNQITTLYGAMRGHRFMCHVAHGHPPSPAHLVAHSCNKGHEGCVNPRHLRWATQAENTADAVAHGAVAAANRRNHGKLTEDDVRAIRKLLAVKTKQREIASQFGVSQALINYINVGTSWAHV